MNLLDIKPGRESIINKQVHPITPSHNDIKIKDFNWCDNHILDNLVVNRDLFYILKNSWALFPDHVVFLGEKPLIINNINELQDIDEDILSSYCFIFINRVGVLQNVNVTSAQVEQLSCYYDVISNIDPKLKLKTLSKNEISELLNWDAEVYRQNLANK